MHIDISHHTVHTALTLVGCATMITCTLCSSANLRKRCSKEPQYFHGTSTATARNKGNVWCYLRPTCLMRRFCLAQEGLIISLSLHLISGGVSLPLISAPRGGYHLVQMEGLHFQNRKIGHGPQNGWLKDLPKRKVVLQPPVFRG